MSDPRPLAVRGKALYLEFKQPSHGFTFQVLVHPDGVDSDGKYVRFGTFHRQLSVSYPKRLWTRAQSGTIRDRMIEHTESTSRVIPPVDYDVHQAILVAYQTHVNDILDQLKRQGYTLFKQPVVVEVSNVDYDEIQADKTPYALFRRVMSARKALDFPEALV
jgi:hypothetical protein